MNAHQRRLYRRAFWRRLPRLPKRFESILVVESRTDENNVERWSVMFTDGTLKWYGPANEPFVVPPDLIGYQFTLRFKPWTSDGQSVGTAERR
mgnify:FL=1